MHSRWGCGVAVGQTIKKKKRAVPFFTEDKTGGTYRDHGSGPELGRHLNQAATPISLGGPPESLIAGEARRRIKETRQR